MSGLFSRHMSVRAMAATWLVLGLTLGVYERGLWIHDPRLWRIGAGSVVALGVILIGIALAPRHWLSRYWQDNQSEMRERLVILPSIGVGMLLGIVLPWISPRSATATAAVAIAAALVVAVVLLWPDATRSVRHDP